MTNITFFTPIQYANENRDPLETIIETVDDYFFICGKKATVIEVDKDTAVLLRDAKTSSLLSICLKVISYFTLVIPFLMLIAKTLLREVAPESYTMKDGSLPSFYATQGILENPAKHLEVNLESLGLNLDDPLIFPRPVPPGTNPLTLKDAARDMISQINSMIDQQKDQKDKRIDEKRMTFCDFSYRFGMGLKPVEKYEFQPVPEHCIALILKALNDNGHIFSMEWCKRIGTVRIQA